MNQQHQNTVPHNGAAETSENIEQLEEKSKFPIKEYLTIILAMVGIIGFVGQYFVNTYRLGQIEKNNLVAQFNFMGERPRSSDCWYPLKHPFIKNLIEKIAKS